METYDPHKSTPEVRQGSRTLANFRVLIWSTIGIILAFGIIYVIFYVLAPASGTAA